MYPLHGNVTPSYAFLKSVNETTYTTHVCLIMWQMSTLPINVRCNVCCSCWTINSLSIPLSCAPGYTCLLCVVLTVFCSGSSLSANCFHWHSSWVLPCFQGWTWGRWRDDDNYITASTVNYMTCVFFLQPTITPKFLLERELSCLFSYVIKQLHSWSRRGIRALGSDICKAIGLLLNIRWPVLFCHHQWVNGSFSQTTVF